MKRGGRIILMIIAVLVGGSQLWLAGWGFKLFKNISLIYGPLTRTDIAVETNNCDSQLGNYVYSPKRLFVINPCGEIRGTVTEVFANGDGDYHIEIKPDLKYKNTINLFNRIAWKGALVTEVICAHANKEVDCLGYMNEIKIPKKGDRVKITGSYVIDTPYGWTEIHPVSRIEIEK